jgi:hypothetical protein
MPSWGKSVSVDKLEFSLQASAILGQLCERIAQNWPSVEILTGAAGEGGQDLDPQIVFLGPVTLAQDALE